MGQSKKLKNLHSIFKDKTEIIKATFSFTNRPTTIIQIAVLRSTTRSAGSPPHDHHLSTLLSISHATRHSASECVSAIIHRLHHHHEPNAYVALKSLITLHHMIISGSLVHKEQFSYTKDLGFLNLSRFVDDTDTQSKEFSLWAQWYARFLESNLSTSAVLGCPLSSSKTEIEKKRENIKFSLYIDLFKEVESLLSMIEEICRAPKSLHCQTNDIIYEVMRLVGDDYRTTQYHMTIRLIELSERMHNFSSNELDGLTRCLKRLEGCKEQLIELFLTRKRNESFWDLKSEVMSKLMDLKEERKMKSVTQKMIEYVAESTQLRKQLTSTSRRRLGLFPLAEASNWLTGDRVNLTVTSTANA